MPIIVTDNGTVDGGGGGQHAIDRPKFGFDWTGGDGSAWDLVNGPVGLLSGARGFGMPAPQHRTYESPLDGAAWQGVRIPPREVFMPVTIDRDFLNNDRSFFAGLDPRTEGRLRVTTPDATWREIACRYVEGAEGEYEFDPLTFGYATYGIRLVANDPYWRGVPVVQTMTYQPNPHPTTGFTIPFTITPVGLTVTTTGASGNNATVNNPGDVPAVDPVWRVSGPYTGFTVGVGPARVSVAASKGAGQWVEVNMDARRLTVVDEAGRDMWDSVTEFKRSTLPPGDGVVTTQLQGMQTGASVRLSFTPRYWRAW